MKHTKIQSIIKEQILFLVIAFLPYYSGVGILNAQTLPEGTSFFTEPLTVSRGTINPSSPNAEVWQKSVWCDIVKKEWGWTTCEGLDAFIVGYDQLVGTMIFESPNSDGLVTFDDWKSEDLGDTITQIENSLKESLKEQSKQVGTSITFKKWRVYPTLNEEKKILYYATDIDWGGEVSTNIKASLFDRRGYVTMVLIPTDSNLDGSAIERIVLDVASHYSSAATEDYSAFVSGDKVAAVGAVGVLATLIGVKYSKVAAGGAMLVLLALLKKAWILLLLPLYWLKNLFKRKQ